MATVAPPRTPFARVSRDIIGALWEPDLRYRMMMAVLLAVLGWAAFAWIYQIKVGMGVAGITHPVMWGVYITNFVFWVGIAHSGTLISAILYLMRSGWRTTINRTAEAMTIFAVTCAGIFPAIHVGRVWVVHWLFGAVPAYAAARRRATPAAPPPKAPPPKDEQPPADDEQAGKGQ